MENGDGGAGADVKSVEGLLRQGLEHHHAGRLQQARRAYEEALGLKPDDPNALYLAAVLASQAGNPGQAVELARRALAAGKDAAQCHNLIGLAWLSRGDLGEAGASFERAVAIQLSPAFCFNLGTVRSREGRFDEAIAAFEQAVAADPGLAAAHHGAGRAYRAKQDRERAEACLRRASGLRPDDADLHRELGDALQELGRLEEALAEYRQALALDPRAARAWYAAGCADNTREEFAAAMDCFGRALELRPEWPEAQHNLGQALFSLGQVDEALELMRRAASRGPAAIPRAMIAVVIPGSPKSGNQEILDARRAYAAAIPAPGAALKRPPAGGRAAHAKLRVGYVSSFFQRPNWMKPVWGLINQHDRGRFEIHLFSDAPAAAISGGYRANPEDHYYDTTRLSNEETAALIEASEIDLLVDLNGYSNMQRLPLYALRPAPVIAGWFNLYASTGLACFDYLIGDEEVIPAEEEQFYGEKILRVPGSCLTFEVGYAVPPVAAPPCLSRPAVTFGCLASQYKITSEVIAAWSRILAAAPESTLLLKNATLAAAGNRRFVHERFREHGIAPERVRLEGGSEHYEFLRRYDEIDAALDTFPYNGGTTTTEAIWQGVPVIAFAGDRWAARTSASILRAGGLGEFVGRGLEEYVSLAVALAQSRATPARLEELRREMRARLAGSPVCDTRSFARAMERLYVRMGEGGR